MRNRLSAIGMLLAVAVLAPSCSGSRSTRPSDTPPPPTGPSIASGTAFTVRSGETDEVVTGATVSLSASSPAGAFTASYTTNGDGEFRLDRAVLLSSPPQLDITAPGFLARATILRQEEPTITLWPSSSQSGLDEDFSETIAYSTSVCPAVNTGQAVLRKLLSSATTVQVVLSDALRDGGAEPAQQVAISRLNLALGDGPRFELATTASPGGVSFSADLAPSDPNCVDDGLLHAFTQVTSNGFNVVGGRFGYCSIGAARSATLVLHELGHATGLYHSSSTSDVMYCSAGRPTVFSNRERVVMKLARQRRAGNRWPDNDRLANPLLILAERRVDLIACSETDRSR